MNQIKTLRPSPTALLNPCIDPIFKRLFTDNSPEGRNTLKCFLEAVLQRKVTNIILQPEEIPIDYIHDKKARFDLNCEIDGIEFANIEIQNYNSNHNFEKRAEYYCAHLLNYHVPEGLPWNKVPKVYQISILNFIRETSLDREIFYYKFRSEDGLSLEDRQNIIFIELPKIKKIVKEISVDNEKIKKLTPTQKWCIFMLYASKEEFAPLVKEIANYEEGIMSAVKTLDKISQDYIAWKQQFDQLMLENDRLTLLEEAEEAKKQARATGWEEGIKEGREEGIKEGRKEGIREGREEGIREGRKEGIREGLEQGIQQGIQQGVEKNSLEIAEKLLKNNIPLEIIHQTTGIPMEKLQSLLD